MAFYSGMTLYSSVHIELFGLPAPLVLGAVYAILIAVGTLAVCVLTPKLKRLIEPLAFSRLFVGVFVLIHPDLGKLLLANPILMSSLVIAGGLFLSRAMLRPSGVPLPQAI